MTTAGGGWTLELDTLGNPDMSGQSDAVFELSVTQVANIRFVSSSFDAYYMGHSGDALPGASFWTILAGDPSSLYGQPWSVGVGSAQSIFVRESNTQIYPSSVPVPATVWLFGSGLLGMIVIARRKKAA
jgi:hypothetical protein